MSEVLLEDNFEKGFSTEWADVSRDIAIVKDETSPGNHVARISKTRVGLKSIPKNLKQATELAGKLEGWSHYELSFRFRVGSLETDLTKDKRHTTLMNVGFNSKPEEGNPYEKRSFWVQVLRVGKKNWHIQGPKIAWYEGNGRFEKVLHTAPRTWTPLADTDWHVLRIVSAGELSTIYFDDEEIFRGEDSRVTYGGISIESWWDNEILDPKWIDIDDVKVVKTK